MHSDELKSEWKEDWRNSERGKAALRINESTPSGKFLKLISNPKLPKAAASKITQLRLTHIPLNSYLKRIQKVDTARCPACGEDKENIVHFLLRCPGYAHDSACQEEAQGPHSQVASRRPAVHAAISSVYPSNREVYKTR